MNNSKYFESIAKQMKNVDLNDVLVSIDPEYEGKSLNEIASIILEKGDYIKLEKINAFIEKYDDEILDANNEIKELEEKYQVAIKMAIADQEEANRKRISYIEKYDDYNKQSEIENIEKDANDEINLRISEIDHELEQINRKEMLLNGELSGRMTRKREELTAEKSELEGKKVDIEDSKREAYYLAKEEEKNIKKAQDTRNELIKELSGKKIEMYQKLGELRKEKKKYMFLSNEILSSIVDEKNMEDNKYEEIKNKLDELIISGDLDLIKDFLPIYREAIERKMQSDKKINDLFDNQEKENNEKEPVLDNLIEDDLNESVEKPIENVEPIENTTQESVGETIEIVEPIENTAQESVEEPIENVEPIEDTAQESVGETIENVEPIENTAQESVGEPIENVEPIENSAQESVGEPIENVELIENTVQEPVFENITDQSEEQQEEIPNPFKMTQEELEQYMKETNEEYVDNLSDESNVNSVNTNVDYVDYNDEEKSKEHDNLEEFGFYANPINSVIEPQSDELVSMNDVMPELNIDKENTNNSVTTDLVENIEENKMENEVETKQPVEQQKNKKGLFGKLFGGKEKEVVQPESNIFPEDIGRQNYIGSLSESEFTNEDTPKVR